MERLLMGANPALLETGLLTAADYPIRFSEDRLDRHFLAEMSWRWHPDLEFNVVLDGTVDFFVEDSCERLSAGQGILKNADVLHRSALAPGCDQADLFSIVMGAEFIAPAQSLIYQKYMAPIQGGRRLRFLPLLREIPWQCRILELLLTARREQEGQTGAVELRIHELMCAAWRGIAEHAGEIPAQYLSPQSLTEQIRIKQMLSCIHTRYQEKLTLREIAAAANISENTCRNTFRTVVHRSPTEYLIEYRLQQALRLLWTTDLTAEEIARQCGFGDSSYFSRLFRLRVGMSPIQYRRVGDTEHPASSC